MITSDNNFDDNHDAIEWSRWCWNEWLASPAEGAERERPSSPPGRQQLPRNLLLDTVLTSASSVKFNPCFICKYWVTFWAGAKILVQSRPVHDGGRLIDRNSGALFWFYAPQRLLKLWFRFRLGEVCCRCRMMETAFSQRWWQRGRPGWKCCKRHNRSKGWVCILALQIPGVWLTWSGEFMKRWQQDEIYNGEIWLHTNSNFNLL